MVDVVATAGAVRGSRDWWFHRLTAQREGDVPQVVDVPVRRGGSHRDGMTREQWYNALWAWRQGEGPFLRLQEEYTAPTREFLRLTNHNYAPIVVSTLADRCQILGGATVDETDDDARAGNRVIQEALDANGSALNDGHDLLLTFGDAGWLVGPPPEGATEAIITPIDPRQAAWETHPITRRVRAFARWVVVDDAPRVYLYLGEGDDVGMHVVEQTDAGWEWVGTEPLPVPELGVPFVPLREPNGVGRIEPHLGLLERIQNGLADRLWAGKHQLWIMRAFIGEFPDEVNGQPVDWDEVLLNADPGAILKLPTGVEPWESKTIDLAQFREVIKDDLRMLAAESKTPLNMFVVDAANQSAEGSQQAEKALIFEAQRFRARHKPDAARALQLVWAHSVDPDTGELRGGKAPRMRPIWGPVQTYTLGEVGNMIAQSNQQGSKGLPLEIILSRWGGFDPDDIAELRAALERAEMLDLVAQMATQDQQQAQQPADGAPQPAPLLKA